jgi:FMN phosphatase YigB (HAD superfamily)
MSIEIKNYKNIIFDLGGVLLNIDYHKTVNEFQKFTDKDVDKFYGQHAQYEFFDLYETGKISTDEFRRSIKETLDLKASNDDIDDAWCAMLLDFPRHRYDFLKKIAKHKRIFLFSNTCAIHKEVFDKIILDQLGENNFESIFESAYFSHLLGHRKPHPEGFEHILKENNLSKEDTLFIDDSIGHIRGAESIGLNTFHLTNDLDITELNWF